MVAAGKRTSNIVLNRCLIDRYDLRADSFDIEVRKAQHDTLVDAVEIIITHYVLQIVARKVG